MTPAYFGRGLGLMTLACSLALGCGEGGGIYPVGESSAGGGGGYSGGSNGTGGAGGGGGDHDGITGKGTVWGGDGKQDPQPADPLEQTSDLQTCGGEHLTLPYYLSADDSNSMAAPVIAREWLRAGLAPLSEQIRTYEFLNYYNVDYELPDAAAGELGIHLDMMQLEKSTSQSGRRYRLQVGVQAFDVPRPALVLTFVVDSSGSLVGSGMDRARAALLALSAQLLPGDRVSIVTWSNEDSVLLEDYVASGDETDTSEISKAVAKLSPGGGSDLHAGLTRGYELAEKYFNNTKLNRVVLVSDGGANLGVIDRDVIAAAASKANDEGIYMVGIGVGPAKGYSDTLMDLVTDAGRGAYVYLDGPDEATELFTSRFDEVMNVAARDVKVQVDLPPTLEIENFYGESFSHEPEKVEPQHLAPRDSMIFNQTLYATDTSVLCGDDVIHVKVTWQTPIAHEARATETLPITLAALIKEPSPQMLKGNAIIAYAEALKSGNATTLQEALDQVRSARDATGDGDLSDIAVLLALHPALKQ